MPGVALSHSEHVVIEVGVCAGRSNPVIAAELDRPACTIRHEIVRNGGRAKYTADRADVALSVNGAAQAVASRGRP